MGLEQDELLRLLLSSRTIILAYIRSIVRDSHIAEDVFQDLSVIALDKRDTIHDEIHFRGWIRRAARLEAMNTLRREKKVPTVLSEPLLDLLEEHWDNYDDDLAEARVAALSDCVKQLTPYASQLVEMRYIEGISGKRLAEMLNKPVNTIYVAMSRIHQKLAKCVRLQLAEGGSDD